MFSYVECRKVEFCPARDLTPNPGPLPLCTRVLSLTRHILLAVIVPLLPFGPSYPPPLPLILYYNLYQTFLLVENY